jgi:hypothetical protein
MSNRQRHFESAEGLRWYPLEEILSVLRHIDFHWENDDRVKYLELRVDTRDNCAMVRDRHGNAIGLPYLKKMCEDPVLGCMNENSEEYTEEPLIRSKAT